MPSELPNVPWLGVLRQMPCAHCGENLRPLREAHHVETGGMGMKCPDVYAIPLCAACHASHHLGRTPTKAQCRGYLSNLLNSAASALLRRSRERTPPPWYLLSTRPLTENRRPK